MALSDFWGAYSVPLVNMSVLVAVGDSIVSNGFGIWLDFQYCEPSNFIFLSQDFCPHSESSLVAYTFSSICFESMIYAIVILIEIAWYLQISLGYKDILMMLILPTYAHGKCLHLVCISLLFVFLKSKYVCSSV